MSVNGARVVAAVGTVVVAALVNIATGMLTQHWAIAWAAATAVLVVVGGWLQAWLTVGDRAPAGSQRVSGTKVGGTIGQRMGGTGEQSIADSEASGVEQRQGLSPEGS